jgi:hypothetical protein
VSNTHSTHHSTHHHTAHQYTTHYHTTTPPHRTPNTDIQHTHTHTVGLSVPLLFSSATHRGAEVLGQHHKLV